MVGMLHGVWSPGSGLLLWRDPSVSHDDDALPSALRRWTDRPFRHRVELRLPGDDEPQMEITMTPADIVSYTKGEVTYERDGLRATVASNRRVYFDPLSVLL